MKNQCKVLRADPNLEYAKIEKAIEEYCNDGFLDEKSVKALSTTYDAKNDKIVFTIVYEYKFKWLKLLFVLLLISIIIFILIEMFRL